VVKAAARRALGRRCERAEPRRRRPPGRRRPWGSRWRSSRLEDLMFAIALCSRSTACRQRTTRVWTRPR